MWLHPRRGGCGGQITAVTATTTGTVVTTGTVQLYPVVVDHKWGFIDNSGTIKIEPQFDLSNFRFPGFSEGLAAVAVGEKWGYIDKTGAWVIQPQFDYALNFSEGLRGGGGREVLDILDHRLGWRYELPRSGASSTRPVPGSSNRSSTLHATSLRVWRR